MEFLIDPNVAYLAIVGAVMMALITIIVPGTGLPEAGMIICLGVTWYELSRLEPNIWALVMVALSVVPFLFAVRQKRLRMPLLAATILMLGFGSVFLFVDKDGRPLVNFMLSGMVSVSCGLFIWVAVERGLQVQGKRPVNDPDSLVGTVGMARTEVYFSGSVLAGGELWSARSDKPIPEGSMVRILRRDGFTLTVQKMEKISK